MRNGHADDDEVEDHVGHRAAKVDVAGFDAFPICDGYVPGGLYGQTVEDDAE